MRWFDKLKTFYIENQPSPEEVYLKGFSEGFSKAWETMMPYIQESTTNARKLSREATIDELLKNNQIGKK